MILLGLFAVGVIFLMVRAHKVDEKNFDDAYEAVNRRRDAFLNDPANQGYYIKVVLNDNASTVEKTAVYVPDGFISMSFGPSWNGFSSKMRAEKGIENIFEQGYFKTSNNKMIPTYRLKEISVERI